MKTIIAVSIFFFSPFLLAGGSGGGGGVRPGMNFFVDVNGSGNSRTEMEIYLEGGSQVGTLDQLLPKSDGKNVLDFVRTIGFDNSGRVLFQYKGFESSAIVTHTVDVSEFNVNYLDAIKKSQKSKTWEPVMVEGLVN